MDAPSTSSPPRIVLPSIHEMFPEHLMPRTAPHPFPRHRAPTLPPVQGYSFDVLRSDPRGASLQHIASSRPAPQCAPSASPAHSSGSSDGDADMEDDTAAEEGAADGEGEGGEGKKHICPKCSKRFNRPSSLRIHLNTHTGATPFRCPHPGCGRAFNVNSNMRRHYRNHATPAYAPSPSLSPVSPVNAGSGAWSAFASSPTSASPTSASLSSGPPTPSSALPSPATEKPPPWTWAGGASASVYCESDVRSERR
ncbi:hypothetical protein B0H15DRAFT_891431 [Mycena belliarum]|uniref:C2H2-type domain-containing protein n=1 Tax=Mycena belliarum TaxID=1033014 RepID=A0AAD6TV51_9AGAR|nr:hypothetical protein B0H15DRAFT_891431 [Mycena belliae]